jgi:hypothetical protein
VKERKEDGRIITDMKQKKMKGEDEKYIIKLLKNEICRFHINDEE